MKSSVRLELINRLYGDEKFKSLANNTDRIAYFLENVSSYERMQELIMPSITAAREGSRKSATVAKGYKEEADLCLKTDRMEEALVAVHKAIRQTPVQQTALLAELYGLKSRVHHRKKDFTAVLYCIDVCLDLEGGKTNLALLNKKIYCLIKLGQCASALALLEEIISQPELFRRKETHSKAHFVAIKEMLIQDGNTTNLVSKEGEATVAAVGGEGYFTYEKDPRVKIEHSPVVGRHFIATETIPGGTVLLRERPYSLVLELDYWKRKCSSCHLDLKHKFFPCVYCTEPTFCDRACFQTAWQTFHRHECGMASLARGMTMPAAHVFRILSRMGPLEAFDVEASKGDYSIDDYLAETATGDVPEIEKTRQQKESAFRMSSILWDHNDKHGAYSNAHHTVVAVEVATLLDIAHGYRQRRPSTEFLLQFVDSIMVHIRRIIFNVFGWHEYNADWTVRGHVANCQCLVGSLINHSCVPNTSWDWRDGIISFTTRREISKGSEITITYGPSKDVNYGKRQERLNYYYFACRCDLCKLDALKADNLRCRTCNGPVLFDSAVNKEPQLNGKCTKCYTDYEQFNGAITRLGKVKESIKLLSKVSLVLTQKSLVDSAVKLVEDLVDLSLPESEAICQAALDASKIIERCLADPKTAAEMSDSCVAPNSEMPQMRVKMALLFDRALPSALPRSMLNGKSLTSLKFWFDSLVQQSNNDRKDKLAFKNEWDTAIHFEERIRVAMKTLSKEEPAKQLVKEIVAEHDRQLNKQMEKYVASLMPTVSF